jgi:hypothetical protein
VNEHDWPDWPDDPSEPDPHHDALPQHDPHGEADLPAWPGDDPWAAAGPGDGPHDPIGYADQAAHTDQAADADEAAHTGHAAHTGEAGIGGEVGIGGDELTPYPDHGVDLGPLGPVGADPDALPDADAALPFPPSVHIELPDPVDGLPWTDSGTLGVVTADAAVAAPSPVDSAELAAYAETELPPAVDPWAALAASDDPATSALARFWAPGPSSPQ